MTILSVVMMFALFVLFYFPAQQERYLLNNYNKQTQNLANTVALGVKIAMTEQNYEGVQTAMDFVKEDKQLRFVSLIQSDTVWNDDHTKFHLSKSIFRSYPDSVKVDTGAVTNDSLIVKRAPFSTPLMSGEIMLGLTTREIVKSKKQIRITSLLVSLIVFVIGIICGFWLAKNISVPVLALRDAAHKVGEGDLLQRVTHISHDEIGELGTAFNKMVDDLGKARGELEKAYKDLKTTQAQLIQQEKMASFGELTAGIAHEIQNPLNFVNNFSEVSIELIDELKTELDCGNLKEMKTLADDIKQILEKINSHGKRADAIVKGMLQHSRMSTGQKELTDINALADEFFTLSYQGLRAKDKIFNATRQTDFDSKIGKVNIVAQDIGRVLLNLFNNAFYAVAEKKKLKGERYDPIVSISLKGNFNSSGELKGVDIRVRDNGLGIPQKVRDKIFQPFFTTKPPGEGTGLGLSLSYDIIKVYGGEIKVDTKEGEYTEFFIYLPV
jgi:two-component system NtrC family sensor kinase